MSDKIERQLKQIEIEIGQRLKGRRERLGMSRRELAAGIGVTIQQLAKYEDRINRIPVSRLMLAANILGETINYFLPKLPGDIGKKWNVGGTNCTR